MNYLKVSEDDEEFIEYSVEKLMILQESDEFVRDGINFSQLIEVLTTTNFF